MSDQAPFTSEPDVCADAHGNCSDALQHVQDVLDSNGDAELLVQWSTHLKDCPPCGAELEMYERITEALRRCQSQAPADVLNRLTEFSHQLCEGDSTQAGDG
jgi:anti-sigma factor (TIGR02949 family)